MSNDTNTTTPVITIMDIPNSGGIVTVTMNERAAQLLASLIDKQHGAEAEAQRKADEANRSVVEAPRAAFPMREVSANGTVTERH